MARPRKVRAAIPAEVLERARAAAAPEQIEAPGSAPAPDERKRRPSAARATRSRILAALRRLHPMD